MKHIIAILAVSLLVLITGCSSNSPAPTPIAEGVKAKPAEVTKNTLSDQKLRATASKLKDAAQPFDQADLANAAAMATKAGAPAVAGVYQSIAQVGVSLSQIGAAISAQADACKAAVEAWTGSLPQLGGTAGVFTTIEVAREAIGTGVPASVTLNCEPIALPGGTLPIPFKF